MGLHGSHQRLWISPSWRIGTQVQSGHCSPLGDAGALLELCRPCTTLSHGKAPVQVDGACLSASQWLWPSAPWAA